MMPRGGGAPERSGATASAHIAVIWTVAGVALPGSDGVTLGRQDTAAA